MSSNNIAELVFGVCLGAIMLSLVISVVIAVSDRKRASGKGLAASPEAGTAGRKKAKADRAGRSPRKLSDLLPVQVSFTRRRKKDARVPAPALIEAGGIAPVAEPPVSKAQPEPARATTPAPLGARTAAAQAEPAAQAAAGAPARAPVALSVIPTDAQPQPAAATVTGAAVSTAATPEASPQGIAPSVEAQPSAAAQPADQKPVETPEGGEDEGEEDEKEEKKESSVFDLFTDVDVEESEASKFAAGLDSVDINNLTNEIESLRSRILGGRAK